MTTPVDQKERAAATIERFLHKRDAYRHLLNYAALPIVLTPELLHYLRHHFTPKVPYVAEVDILLDRSICAEHAYEQYTMHSNIRNYLLATSRHTIDVRKAAGLMLKYLSQVEREQGFINLADMQAQQWSAMVYVDEQRGSVVEQIKANFRRMQGDLAGHGDIPQEEVLRLANLVEELSGELEAYGELLNYARLVKGLLDGDDAAIEQAAQRVIDVDDLPQPELITGRTAEVAARRTADPVTAAEYAAQQLEELRRNDLSKLDALISISFLGESQSSKLADDLEAALTRYGIRVGKHHVTEGDETHEREDNLMSNYFANMTTMQLIIVTPGLQDSGKIYDQIYEMDKASTLPILLTDDAATQAAFNRLGLADLPAYTWNDNLQELVTNIIERLQAIVLPEAASDLPQIDATVGIAFLDASGTRALATSIQAALKARGIDGDLLPFLQTSNVSGSLGDAITASVGRSDLLLLLISEGIQSAAAAHEIIDNATGLKRTILPVLLAEDAATQTALAGLNLTDLPAHFYDDNLDELISAILWRLQGAAEDTATAGSKIFISYRRNNQEVARQLYEQLQALNYDVFRDVGSLQIGEEIDTYIQEAVQDSAVLLVLLDNDAPESDAIAREVDMARGANTSILPLLVDPTAEETIMSSMERLAISDIQYLRYFDAQAAFEQLREVLPQLIAHTRQQRDELEKARANSTERRIFISYRNTQASDYTVKVLSDRLREVGFSVFADFSNNLRGGDSWQNRILEELQLADVLLLVMGADTAQSEWVQRELNFARGAGVQIVPVLLAGIENAVQQLEQLALTAEQFVTFDGQQPETYTGLLDHLNAIFAGDLTERDDEENEKEDDEENDQLKAALIEQIRRGSNSVVLTVLDQLRQRGWLTGEDGILAGVNLSRANLRGADLSDANLHGTTLEEADLSRARLRNADIGSANWRRANLKDADLVGCDLRLTDLQAADLTTATLYNAALRLAALDDARFDIGTILPDARITGDMDSGDSYYVSSDDRWSPTTDMTRYTEPDHPDFWEPEWAREADDTDDAATGDDDEAAIIEEEEGPLTGQTVLGRYLIHGVIDRSSKTQTYRADDQAVERQVALKVLTSTERENNEIQFRNEARLLARLSHPNIIAIYEHNEFDGQLFTVMQYLGTANLTNWIQPAGVDLPTLLPLLAQIGSALDYIHGRGIVHRNIKPRNIKIDDNGTAYLSEFSIAISPDVQDTSAPGMIVGTIGYVSPEQAQDRPMDGRSDIYSLGVVLYELITGQLPFISKNGTELLLQHVQQPPPPINSIREGVPPEIAAVVMKALAKKPEERYATAGELAQAFREALQAATATSEPRARIRGLPNIPSVVEVNVRSAPLTSSEIVFKVPVGMADCRIIEVQTDAENKAHNGKVYQWFRLEFEGGSVGWVRDDLIEVRGDLRELGYGVLDAYTFAFELERAASSNDAPTTHFAKTVFIAYRRTDSAIAHAVYENLRENGFDVFIDVESIESSNFERIILTNIEQRAHFLLILTPTALDRANQPGDWLRREIEHAIEHKRNIVPLLFDGFGYENMRRQLPPELAATLGKFNGLSVPADYFKDAMERLRERFLTAPLDPVKAPGSSTPDDANVAELASAFIAQIQALREQARNARDDADYPTAIDSITDVIAQLQQALREDTYGTDAQPELNRQLGEAYGFLGGIYNRLGNYTAAADAYEQGEAYSDDTTNAVNKVINRVLANPGYLQREEARSTIQAVIRQSDEEAIADRAEDFWMMADIGLLSLLVDEPDRAYSAYNRFMRLATPDWVYTAHLRVLDQLYDVLSGTKDAQGTVKEMNYWRERLRQQLEIITANDASQAAQDTTATGDPAIDAAQADADAQNLEALWRQREMVTRDYLNIVSQISGMPSDQEESLAWLNQQAEELRAQIERIDAQLRELGVEDIPEVPESAPPAQSATQATGTPQEIYSAQRLGQQREYLQRQLDNTNFLQRGRRTELRQQIEEIDARLRELGIEPPDEQA